MSQIYHKFKDIYDKNGVLIFPVIPAQYFYFDLLKINFRAITEQGIGHLAFFIAFDVASKLGSAVGFARIDERLRVKGSSNSPYNF
jgi:hypothetical protein